MNAVINFKFFHWKQRARPKEMDYEKLLSNLHNAFANDLPFPLNYYSDGNNFIHLEAIEDVTSYFQKLNRKRYSLFLSTEKNIETNFIEIRQTKILRLVVTTPWKNGENRLLFPIYLEKIITAFSKDATIGPTISLTVPRFSWLPPKQLPPFFNNNTLIDVFDLDFFNEKEDFLKNDFKKYLLNADLRPPNAILLNDRFVYIDWSFGVDSLTNENLSQIFTERYNWITKNIL